MKLEDILRVKGTEVIVTTPEERVLGAMRILVEHNIGAVVVVEDEEVRGILSERDILRLGARDPALLASTPVREAMTVDVVVGVPEDDIHYAMNIMTRNRIRHLPIIREGRLEGMVSIGDLVNACRREAEVENRYMRDYIQGHTW